MKKLLIFALLATSVSGFASVLACKTKDNSCGINKISLEERSEGDVAMTFEAADGRVTKLVAGLPDMSAECGADIPKGPCIGRNNDKKLVIRDSAERGYKIKLSKADMKLKYKETMWYYPSDFPVAINSCEFTCSK